MAVTSQPALFVNGRNLNNWFSSEILWKQTEGLFDGAALEPGATLDTFDGKAKIRAHDMAYQARRLVITGRILNRSGWLDKQRAIADLSEVFAGRPAIVRLGTLELEAEFGPVKLVDDAYSHLPGYQTWRVEGEAVPGTYRSQYHTALGADQGLAVQDDRPDSSAVKFASNSFTYTYPGTAPAEACVALTGTASTTYYLKGKGLRRVPMTTDAAGNATIDEASGFLVYPGSNAIRVEDSAGALASGVTAVNLYGTRPRFLGNAPTGASTQSAATNRMSEGPMLTVARTGSATYLSTAGTLATATDGQARIGVPYGTYSASKAGLCLEGAGTNPVKNSDFEVDALGSIYAPSGWTRTFADAGTDVQIISVTGGKACKLVTGGGGGNCGISQTFTGLSVGTVYAVSFDYLDGGSPVNLIVAVSGGASSSFNQAGRQVFTFTATATSHTIIFYITGASLFQSFDKVQFEPYFATSYIQNDSLTATATRSADLCGIVSPHNLLPYSEFQSGFVSPWTWGHFYNTSFPNWIQAPTGGPSGQSAAQVDASGGNGFSPTSVRPITLKASTVYTISAKVHTTSATGAIRIALDSNGDGGTYNHGGNLSLPANAWVRVSRTLTTDTATAQHLKILAVGGGTLTVTELQITEGSHPGVYRRTTDTAIPAPADGGLDPAWMQNGSLKARILPPPISTGLGYSYLGPLGNQNASEVLRLMRYYSNLTSHYLVAFDRKHNSSTGTFGQAGRGFLEPSFNLHDGAPHDAELVWKNYTLDGTRYMPMELWIDGSLVASQDVATLYGATEWAEIDPSKLISDGNVFATISAPSDNGPIIRYPTLPAGAFPAT